MVFAATATASSDPATECASIPNATWDKIEMSDNIGTDRSFSSGGASIVVTGVKGTDKVEALSGTWATTHTAALVVVKTGSSGTGSATGYPGTSGGWTTGAGEQGLSHITFCYGSEDPKPVTKDVTQPFCETADGRWSTGTLTGTGTAADEAAALLKAQEDLKAKAQAKVTAQTDDIIPAFGSPPNDFPGYNLGDGGQDFYDNGCKEPTQFTRTVSGQAPYCTASGEDIVISYTGTATASTPEQAQLDAQAAADADLARQVPEGAKAGVCSTPTAFTATRSATGSGPYCTANAGDVTLYWSGSATATSDVSQSAADTAAQSAANSAAEADRARQLAAYGGGPAGVCAPPEQPQAVTVVEPAVVPPAEPVPVVAPEPATVPEETETVTAPQPATTPAEPVTTTVPTAVQAGGGSTADDGTVPAWALLLVALGALGLAGATTRLLKAPVR